MARIRTHRQPSGRDAGVLLVGVGRFGSAIALTLDALGQDVLAVDSSEKTVAEWAGRFPIVQADATDPEALNQLGVSDFSVGVVGTASSLETSVLVTAHLADAGVPQIWAKAKSAKHGRILERIGANHIVYPEFDAGARVAHLVSGKMLDYIEIEDGFTIVKMKPIAEMVGYSLAQSNIRHRYGVTVIGVKSEGATFNFADANTIIKPTDTLVVSGNPLELEQFATKL